MIVYLAWLDQPSRILSRSLFIIGLIICIGITAKDYAELHLKVSNSILREMMKVLDRSNQFWFIISISLISLSGFLEASKKKKTTTKFDWLINSFPILIIIGVWICHRLMKNTRKEMMKFKLTLEDR
ncbi:hypothetical protein DFH28DRAFT_1004566, partial [Melampsora americana]